MCVHACVHACLCVLWTGGGVDRDTVCHWWRGKLKIVWTFHDKCSLRSTHSVNLHPGSPNRLVLPGLDCCAIVSCLKRGKYQKACLAHFKMKVTSILIALIVNPSWRPPVRTSGPHVTAASNTAPFPSGLWLQRPIQVDGEGPGGDTAGLYWPRFMSLLQYQQFLFSVSKKKRSLKIYVFQNALWADTYCGKMLFDFLGFSQVLEWTWIKMICFPFQWNKCHHVRDSTVRWGSVWRLWPSFYSESQGRKEINMWECPWEFQAPIQNSKLTPNKGKSYKENWISQMAEGQSHIFLTWVCGGT